MTHANAARGAADASSPSIESLEIQIRNIAEQLQHVASLALLSVGGETPEHGAAHLLDGIEELAPDLALLRLTLGRTS